MENNSFKSSLQKLGQQIFPAPIINSNDQKDDPERINSISVLFGNLKSAVPFSFNNNSDLPNLSQSNYDNQSSSVN